MIVDEVKFLKHICTKIKLAYPDFLIAPDPEGGFAIAIRSGQDGAPCLVADLSGVFADYGRADDEADRRRIIEHFLSALGNTVFHMRAPIAPEAFFIQLRHQSEGQPHRGDIYLPFQGDLIAVILHSGDGVMQPVTRANLDVLGMTPERCWALAMQNTSRVAEQMTQDFDADWPGLFFASASQCSPSALIYRDFIRQGAMPDGAYFVCDPARYVYTSVRDEVAMATLVAYQRHLALQADRPVSETLLIRQKGAWHVASLAAPAHAA